MEGTVTLLIPYMYVMLVRGTAQHGIESIQWMAYIGPLKPQRGLPWTKYKLVQGPSQRIALGQLLTASI